MKNTPKIQKCIIGKNMQNPEKYSKSRKNTPEIQKKNTLCRQIQKKKVKRKYSGKLGKILPKKTVPGGKITFSNYG